MRHIVSILPRAYDDAQKIFDWLSERSPLGAVSWYSAFLDAVQELGDKAQECALAPEAGRVGRPIRQFLFKTRKGRTYRLIYLLAEDEAQVLRVRGPGQRLLRRSDLGS